MMGPRGDEGGMVGSVMVSKDRIRRLRRVLIGWFAANRRDMPWRRTRDPYAVWVSEVMLQQTQVETVIPYYERFMRRFPTVGALAAARLDTVLKCWEGLGYYGRARNLHRAAGMVVAQLGGEIPGDREALLRLPGIGAYTAGAIASIAFDRPEPIVDGNVMRVLCRLFRVHGDPRSTQTGRRLWEMAAVLVPRRCPGIFNQALMELGALVCRPGEPDCGACPARRLCEGRRHGEQSRLPIRRVRKPIPRYTVVVGIVEKDGKVLIDRRPEGGLLGGLWEFPGGKRRPRESLKAALTRELREEMDIEVHVGPRLAVVDHAYSHFAIRLHAYHCKWLSGQPTGQSCTAWKWVRPKDLNRYAFPTANKKVITALMDPT